MSVGWEPGMSVGWKPDMSVYWKPGRLGGGWCGLVVGRLYIRPWLESRGMRRRRLMVLTCTSHIPDRKAVTPAIPRPTYIGHRLYMFDGNTYDPTTYIADRLCMLAVSPSRTASGRFIVFMYDGLWIRSFVAGWSSWYAPLTEMHLLSQRKM